MFRWVTLEKNPCFDLLTGDCKRSGCWHKVSKPPHSIHNRTFHNRTLAFIGRVVIGNLYLGLIGKVLASVYRSSFVDWTECVCFRRYSKRAVTSPSWGSTEKNT